MYTNYDESYQLYCEGKEAFESLNYNKAANLLEESNDLFPHFKTLELLGETEIKLKRFTKAITYLAAATALNPSPKAPSLLASAFLALKDNDNAKKFALTVLEQSPNNKIAKTTLSKINV